MTRGRRPHADPPVNVMVSIPGSLNAKLELLLYDPIAQKPRYGGRSALIQKLIRDWIEAQQREAAKNVLTSGPPSAMLNPQDPTTPSEADHD